MGYTSQFKGELKFTTDLKASELAELNKFLGADCREHPEWGTSELSYIDLELVEDFSGVKWDGSEKTYDLVEKINLVIEKMKEKHPNFGLTGELLVQGEEVGDIWKLTMENNVAYQREINLNHKNKITCPHCKEEFLLEENKEDEIADSKGEKCVFVFSGFRNDDLFERVIEKGYTMAGDFSKKVTHLVMKDTSVNSTKKLKALGQGCKIWSISDLEKFLNQ